MVCEMQIAEVTRDTEVVNAGVMKWFDHGNLLKYLSHDHITIDRKLQLVIDLRDILNSIRMLTFCWIQVNDIANAICHVHSRGRTVGNIHPVSPLFWNHPVCIE
jgi:hypothetical protein